MLTQNLIEVQSDYQSLYSFSLRLNPSNRIQVSVHPHYETRGSKSPDLKTFSTTINTKASQLWFEGKKEQAIDEVTPKNIGSRQRPSAFCWEPESWHLSQTASMTCYLIYYLWSVVGVPGLAPRKKFTATARLRILDAAGALEKSGYEYGNFYFFTGTLPGSSDLACQFFARNSRPFLDALKGFLRKKYNIYLTFNCWEWQLREKFHLTPALHLHLVIVTKDDELGAKLPDILKNKWFELLDYYSDKYAVDLYEKHRRLWTDAEIIAGYGRWSREQLEKLASREKNPCHTCKTIRCEKSPAAYLSKYVGKGSLSDDDEFQERFKKANLPLYYPSSWWSISNDVRKLIDSLTYQVGFRNTLDECFRAYHLLEEILEDTDWDLLQLSLPVFIPKWANETRLYRNFYCKPENFEACQQFMEIFNGASSTDSTKTLSGEPSKIFKNAPYPKMDTPLDALKAYFEADKNHHKKQQLIHSVPFYHRTNGGQDVDWTNPLVVWNAKDILNRPSEYPEKTTEDLEKDYALAVKQRELEYSRLSPHQKYLQENWIDVLEGRIPVD